MNTRHIGIFGMAALGLALAAPVQAAPDLMDAPFMVVGNDRNDEIRNEPRDGRKQEVRRTPKREAVRDEPQGYGYGYERRQQQRPDDVDRSRGRR